MPKFEIDGASIHYVYSKGENVPSGGRRPVLLLIHGLGSSECFYAPLIPALVGSGYSCLRLDTPGSGRSTRLQSGSDVSQLAGAIEHLVKSLAIRFEDIVVVGHSMGTLIAAQLADSMMGLILIGPVFPSSGVASVFKQRIESVEKDGMEALADKIPTAATGSKAYPIHHAFIRNLLLSQDTQGYSSLCKTIVNAPSPKPLRNTHLPLLVIAGGEDKTATPEMADQFIESLQNTNPEVKTLPGVGHWHCIEAPEVVADLIIKFAERFN